MPQKIIEAIISLFRYHKLKIATIFGSMLLFLVLLFPYSDLGDLVTSQVSTLTAGQIYVQFDALGLNLVPQPGFEMKNVAVETPFLPTLTAESLVVAPSISGLLFFRPGISARAKGLWGGTLSLSTRGGSKTDAGTRKQVISLSSSRTSLSALTKFMAISVPLQGQASLDVDATIDPNFNEQPKGEVELTIDKFELVSSNVPTPFGPLNVPQLNLKTVELKGKLADGRFNIEEGKLGSSKDELVGTIKGEIMVRAEKRGNQVSWVPGRYTLDIDLTVQPALAQKAALFLSFLDSFKQTTPQGIRYGIHATGSDFNGPPQMSPRR